MATRPKSRLDTHLAGVKEILGVLTRTPYSPGYQEFEFEKVNVLRARILTQVVGSGGSRVTDGYLEVLPRPKPNPPKDRFDGLRLKGGSFSGIPRTTAMMFASQTAIEQKRGEAYLLVPGKTGIWTVEKFRFKPKKNRSRRAR